MPGLATGNGGNPVLSATGSGNGCTAPMISTTLECSSNVFIGGKGIVRAGDKMAAHNRSGCTTEQPTLSTFSNNIFINGFGAGRIGDNYQGDGTNIIQAAQDTSVFGS